MLTFGLMGLILKPLVNLLVSLSNRYPWVTRMLLFLLLVATYFIYKHLNKNKIEYKVNDKELITNNANNNKNINQF